jgi:transposase-like protein
VDETYVKVKGRWTDPYRAVDSRGQTIDLLLSAMRDDEAASVASAKRCTVLTAELTHDRRQRGWPTP